MPSAHLSGHGSIAIHGLSLTMGFLPLLGGLHFKILPFCNEVLSAFFHLSLSRAFSHHCLSYTSVNAGQRPLQTHSHAPFGSMSQPVRSQDVFAESPTIHRTDNNSSQQSPHLLGKTTSPPMISSQKQNIRNKSLVFSQKSQDIPRELNMHVDTEGFLSFGRGAALSTKNRAGVWAASTQVQRRVCNKQDSMMYRRIQISTLCLNNGL